MALPYRLPSLPLTINVWRFSSWSPSIPPLVTPDVITECNLTPGRRVFEQADGPMSYILFLKDIDIRFSEAGTWIAWPPTDPDLVEVPAGSGRYYIVADVESVGAGFANEHQEASIVKQSPWPGSGAPPGGSLLLEDATSLLLEDATDYLLE